MIHPLKTTNHYCRIVGEGHHWWALVDEAGEATLSRWLEVNCNDEWFISVIDRSSPTVALKVIAVVFASKVDRDVAIMRF